MGKDPSVIVFAKSDPGINRKLKAEFGFLCQTCNARAQNENKDFSCKFFFVHGGIVLYAHMCE